MAVLWQFSGDHIAAADLPTYFDQVYAQYGLGTSLLGNGLVYYGSAAYEKKIPASTSIWFHAHFKVTSLSYAATVFSLNLAGGRQVYLMVTTAGYLQFYRANHLSDNWSANVTSVTVGDVGTIQLSTGTWYSIEAEVTIDNSAGVVKTWVNGVADIDDNALDTQYQTSATADGISFVANQNYCYMDNIVVGNTTSPNTGHPGEVRVDCMMPNANGTDSTMTRSTGSDDYALVDEAAASTETGDYWYADAVGEHTSVNVSALVNAGGTIIAAQCTVYATKNEAGPCGFKIYCLRGGTRYYSDEFFPSFGSWQFYRKVWDQDPSTSAAWTESNFNAAEFGTERTT